MRREGIALGCLCVALAAVAQAQSGPAFAGGEAEQYLRALQVAGGTSRYPLSLRSLSADEVGRLGVAGPHPWSERLAPPGRMGWVQPSVTTIVNSGLPYGRNDGALWAGRGLTVALQAGWYARRGPLSLTVAPLAYATTNSSFWLVPNGRGGDSVLMSPLVLDQPQRFGFQAFGRLEPGETSLRLSAGPFAVGLSTAAMVWGPAAHMPLILGANGGGFPHGFAGTARPLNVGIGRIHGRVIWGRLTGSAWAFRAQDDVRYAPAIVGVYEPRWLPGLEIGGTRFFHLGWPVDGLRPRDLLKPFEAIFKKSLATDSNRFGNNRDDQLASVFARWVFPAAGFEVYGEFGRADHNWNLTDFVLQPDHSAAVMVGAARVRRTATGDLVAVRIEHAGARRTQLARFRNQPIWYTHRTGSGHTYRGQLLGSPAVLGGGGTVVRVDRYHQGGRWSVMLAREMVRQDAQFAGSGVEAPHAMDVIYAAGVERLRFGRRVDLTTGVTLVQELNRGFRRDAFNLNLVLRANLASRPAQMEPAASR